MDFIHIALLTACVGHLICCYCDWQITYTPNGRFSFGDLKDNNRLSALFIHTSQKRSLRSILFGVLAMTLELFGYLALCAWMNQYSSRCALIMVISTGMAFISGVVHHVFCGTVEWFYLQFDCTEAARKAILSFFKKTSATAGICFVGLLLFAVTLLVAILLGWTDLPRWACIFNLLPLFLLLAPFRIVGTLNIVGALMFAGLFVLI